MKKRNESVNKRAECYAFRDLGPRGEEGSNLRCRKARRRDLALIRVVDTGLRLVDLSRSSSRVCGGRSFRFIAVGPCAHIHTLANSSRKVERGSVLRREARALLKSKRKGRKKGEGIKEKKERERERE